jgi:predicted TIM-barrel fold metal-dependent hydrolase
MSDIPDYGLISCDDHLDLNQLPADLWTSRLPASEQERAPKVEEKNGAYFWTCDGANWGFWSGAGRGFTGPKPIFTAFDRGGIVDQTERRPAVPELRLADMDRDGVQTHVIFGPVTSIKTKDEAFSEELYRVYNDWLADYCKIAPQRLLGVPMLPPNPEGALREVLRLAARGGVKQANLQIAQAEPRLHDERWAPLWNALEETGIILSWHVTVFFPPEGDPSRGKMAGHLTHMKSFVTQFLDAFVDLFAWGILERHPNLKVVIAESGAGWLPWVVEELDYRHWRLWEAEEFWADKGGIPLKTKPSDLFKRQIYSTFQQSPVTMRLLEFYGDNLLWASDYPHPDSIWPNSRGAIERTMGHLPPEAIRKLTHDNAAKLYGLETPAAKIAAE